MAWSQSELDALKAAFAAGVLSVSYDGKRVDYGSAEDLMRRIQIIEREVATVAGSATPTRSYFKFQKG